MTTWIIPEPASAADQSVPAAWSLAASYWWGGRLKGPGMHWTEAGALAVTALKAIDLNGHWHNFWQNLTLAA